MTVFSPVKRKTHSWRRKLFRNDYFSYKFSFSHKHTINFNEKVFLSFILYSNFPIHLFSIYPQQDNKSYCTNSSFGYKVINHNCKFTINRKNYNQLGRDRFSFSFPFLFYCMKTLSAGSARRCVWGGWARTAGERQPTVIWELILKFDFACYQVHILYWALPSAEKRAASFAPGSV